MLWEFTSAITPSAVGGTSFAIIYVHKEGINVGKSSAIVLLTSFLDELYFIVMFPLLIWIVGHEALFNIPESHQIAKSLIGILSMKLDEPVEMRLMGCSKEDEEKILAKLRAEYDAE